MGATYDLRALRRGSSDPAYFIKDGDIPCTPLIEPTYSYLWNFCDKVSASSLPVKVCDPETEIAAAVQYLDRADGYQECHVIGRYESSRDDLYYKPLNPDNPAEGVSMSYPSGESCPNNINRSATIDIMCANVEANIISAEEPDECQYHLVMKSYYGCPTSCPITKYGLCNSHGHCSFDPHKRQAYCYCNSGWTGDSCSSKATHASSYDGFSVQLGLLITLLVILLGVMGVVGYLVYHVYILRQENKGKYSSVVQGTELTSSSSSYEF